MDGARPKILPTMKIVLPFLLAAAGCLWLLPTGLAQQGSKVPIAALPSVSAKKSPEMTASLLGIATPNPANSRWQPVLLPPPPSKNESEDQEELRQIKAEKAVKRQQFQGTYPLTDEAMGPGTGGELPIIATNFEGNLQNGCPPDNTLAISNTGLIVSCVNSNMYIFNDAGTFQSSTTLVDFFSNLSPNPNLCDPKVIYDPGADRFILYTQVCTGFAVPNQILLAFSQSNNPLGAWWIYGVDGDPLNDNSWLDYPKIGVSTNEFYLTGNLFFNNGNYNESIVYQFTKSSGYNGETLQYQVWSDIDGNPFTIQPLSWGQGSTYGPGVYLVATDALGGNVVRFYDLTNDLTAVNEAMVQFPINVPAYSPPPNAVHAGSNTPLDSGDSRMMDGFYLDGTAHFVFSEDVDNWSSIRYCRLNVSAQTIDFQQISFPGEKDYSYASVASFATSQADKTTVVGFLSSGNVDFPEFRIKYYDNDMNTVGSTLVKNGNTSVSTNFCFDPDANYIRWGDYSGMARRHNATGREIWMSGCFGKTGGNWGTWIAEILDDGNVATGEKDDAQAQVAVAPNPVVQETFTIKVIVDEIELASFRLMDQQGRLVEELYEGRLLPGENLFSFSQNALSNGTYYLVITSTSTQKILANEKIMVAR